MRRFYFWLVIFERRSHEKQQILKRVITAKKGESKSVILELAKQLIDKECLIYTFNSQIVGTVKQVTDGGILVEANDKSVNIINPDYVVRLREYLRKKSGKKKSIVTD